MPKLRLRREGDDEQGAVVVLTALALVVIMGMAAIVIDVGDARQARQQSQAAADAAALAGAADLSTLSLPGGWPTVVGAVETYAQENLGVAPSAWAGCQDPGALAYLPDAAHSDSCISADSGSAPTSLRVVVPTVTVAAGFASVLGQGPFSVRAGAEAGASTTAPCALCVLSPTGTALSISGAGGSIVVSGAGGGPTAGIAVDSTAASALVLSGAGNTVSAEPIDVHGGYQNNGAGNTFSPSAPSTGASYVPDPLASLPVPESVSPPASSAACTGGAGGTSWTSGASGASLTVHGAGIGCVVSPGLYTTISVTGAGDSLTMQPGTYVFTGGLTTTGAGVRLTAEGVTLYFTCAGYASGGSCASGQSGAAFAGTGAGVTYTITPPTSGTYQGVSIFYDRNNTANLAITGAGNSGFTGTVYARSSDLTLTGAGVASGFSLDAMIVVSKAALKGAGGSLTDSYSAADNAPLHMGSAHLTH